MADRKVTYSGIISDGFELFNQYPQPNEILTVDLEKVTMINSVGVKGWITWLNKLKPTVKVVFENCPFVIVNQASTVSGFLSKNMEIRSFFAYFICPNCNAESSLKMENGKHYWHRSSTDGKFVTPTDNLCSKCGVPLEADFIPEKSLAFLKT